MGWIKFLCVFVLLAAVDAKGRGFGPGEQDYGYVDVREGAHMFWWLYHTTADVAVSSDRPLIMWLQGGPGGSSCGYGNFEILGPWDLDLQPRNYTWVNDFNLLLVDNPVGTGYSYVDDLSLLTKTNAEIARDLVSLMKSFYEQLPQFKSTPFYIYGQSYGGKMALDFARLLVEEVQNGNIESNIQGVAMGNAWISPVTATLSWAPFLYQVGLVDEKQEAEILEQAKYTEFVFNSGDYYQATIEWAITEYVILDVTDGVDFYNILTKMQQNPEAKIDNHRTIMQKTFDRLTHSKYYNQRAWDLDLLMNGPVKEALGIPENVHWGSQSNDVFDTLGFDFMLPVDGVVESLLNETSINVHVYNGNMDLICDTPGQMIWINQLKYPQSEQWKTAARRTIWVNNQMEGYEKTAGKFSMFWINVAGHSVPRDNPAGSRSFLRSMTGV